MRVLGKIACLTLAACSASIAGPANAATQFNFQFDNAGLFDNEGMPVHDGTLDQPIVGTGTFISPIDLAPGTYDLTSLAGFSVTFSFTNGDTFSTSDITTPLTGVSVFIADLGGGAERLFFVESGGAGSDGGPHFGALDLDSGSTFLSFAPSSFGNFLYQESGDSGRYHALGSAVPEPTTWATMLIGFAAIGFSLRRARTRLARTA